MEARDLKASTPLPAAVDAVVVGGGHAGIEAAWALGRVGYRVALVTFDAGGLGRMSCNPSIGGLAKGQLAREVDALGGCMGRLIDRTGIHFRMLNRSKGPAVHAPRAQADKPAYCRAALEMLRGVPTLTVIEGEVSEIETERAVAHLPRVTGVVLQAPGWSEVEPGGAHSRGAERPLAEPRAGIPRVAGRAELACRVVLVAAGTFLRARLFTGMDPRPGGRRGEPPAAGLSAALEALGLGLARLKTGTPPRLRSATIDFSRLRPQPGDEPPPRFSFFETTPVSNRVLCHLTRTTPRTHAVIRAALDRSPLFGGLIQGVGPRYCPSIEDKIVRFPQRESHQVFLEPEDVAGREIYPNGVSTSLPEDVQRDYLRTIPGLEEVEIEHPGYAVEYDFLVTSQTDSGLQIREIEGLFAAGQINGTSGYEEAAAQGIVAGLNAAAWLDGRSPLRLRRDQAYIGVLIDDLITKVPTEPYRMFTSQSEYRLLLRQDNADLRLSRIGVERGLLSAEEGRRVEARWRRIEAERKRLEGLRLKRQHLDERASPPGGGDGQLKPSDLGKTAGELLKRPSVSLQLLSRYGITSNLSLNDEVSLEADIRYVGYVKRLLIEVARSDRLERLSIPPVLLEHPPTALSREARERLRERRPETLGQAQRIPGITPCDISVLAVLIHARSKGRMPAGSITHDQDEASIHES